MLLGHLQHLAQLVRALPHALLLRVKLEGPVLPHPQARQEQQDGDYPDRDQHLDSAKFVARNDFLDYNGRPGVLEAVQRCRPAAQAAGPVWDNLLVAFETATILIGPQGSKVLFHREPFPRTFLGILAPGG